MTGTGVRESAAALTAVLERQASAMTRLREALVERRRSFVEWRRSALGDAVSDLEALLAPLLAAEDERHRRAAELGGSLGLPPDAPVAALVARLPDAIGGSLAAAAARARATATRLRVENAVGAGLLEFASRAQASLWRSLAEESAGGAEGYDHRSRRVVDAPPGGRLIDGRV